MELISNNVLFWDVGISEQDIYAAMQDVPGYIDISIGDCIAIWRFAQDHARQRIFGRIRAGDLMNRSIVPLTPNLTLHQAIRHMSNQGLNRLPVVDSKNDVIGVLSESDIVKYVGFDSLPALLAGMLKTAVNLNLREKCDGTQVTVAMTAPALTLRDNANYEEIVEAFRIHGRNSLPVVGLEGQYQGVLECNVFGRFCREELKNTGDTQS